MTGYEQSSLMVGVVALLLSLFNSYWIHLRKGRVWATAPSQFSLRPHKSNNSTASIIIQTLIHSTGAAKVVIDQLYCEIERVGYTQAFTTWQTAGKENAIQRRSGLVVDSQGADEAFCFFVTPGTEEFNFVPGDHHLRLKAKRADKPRARVIFEAKFNLSQNDIEILKQSGAIQFFRDPTHGNFVKLGWNSDGSLVR